MSWLSSFLKPGFRTIQEAEQAAFRALSIGFIAIGIGLLIAFLASKSFGVGISAIGGMVVLGNAIRFTMISKNTTTKNCPRCGTPNPVFEAEHHFKCLSCGRMVILRDV